MKKTKILNKVLVEEDGEDVFLPMPKHCIKFPCNGEIKLDKKGFMSCTICGASYGENFEL